MDGSEVRTHMDLRLNYSMKIFVGYDTREDIA